MLNSIGQSDKNQAGSSTPKELLAPHNVEAEQAVLGAMMGGNTIHDLKKWLQPYHFYLVRHQWIYEAMLSLAHRGEDVDNVSLYAELVQRKQTDDVPAHYLTELINAVDYFTNFKTYGHIVKECWKRRELVRIATRLAQSSITFSPGGQESAEAKRLLTEAVELMNDPYDPQNDGLRQYLVDAKDLANMPDITWLVPGEIPERGLTVIYGPSGVGKSFFVLDYALRIAQSMTTLYVAAEGESGFKRRVAAWTTHHHQSTGDLKFYLNVAALLDETERGVFVNQIVDFVKPKLIILDTVAHCMLPGDENSARDMGLFIRAAKEIQRTYNCAVLLVHHTNKEGAVERGSGALRGAADSMIKLTGDDDVIMVECSKSKDASAFETRYIRLLPVEVGQDDSGSPVYSPIVIDADKVERTKSDPVTNQQRLILTNIAELFSDDGAAMIDLIEVTKLNKGNLFRSLAVLKKLNFLSQKEKGSSYFITEDGLKAIGKSSPTQSDSAGAK